MAANFATTAYTNVVIIFSTLTTNLSFAADRIRVYARDVWRRIVDEPMLAPPLRAESVLPVVLQRFIARMSAPILVAEPSFVGAGLAFRRWR